MAAPDGDQKELLALLHQHLVQAGYVKAAKELLRQSGQKTFPSPPVSLQDIFAQWKKICPQAEKQKADDTKKSIPAKIRVPDPKSSSESSDEEEAATDAAKIKTKPFMNVSVGKAETSSEDEDSSSEEEAVAGKVLKTPGTGNKTTDFLQLAAQKTNSFPGKGVAVAAVRAKEQLKKPTVSKALSPAVSKPGQKKAPSGKQGTPLQTLVVQDQIREQPADEKKTTTSSESSSSSESEKEKTLPAVKFPPPQQALKKAESSSEDSSDDSDSEEETKAAAVQVKPGMPRTQISLTPVKSSPATVAPSKGSAVKVSLAKTKANQVGTPAGSAARSSSSETSDSSDSEEEKPSSAAQTKLPGKAVQTSIPLATNAPSNQAGNKGVSAPALLKLTPKPSVTNLRKLSSPAKKVQSSESSESSSETENEDLPVPVSQKRLQTPQPPTGTKQSQNNKPGSLVKAASSALKGKETESTSSSSSGSEDEVAVAASKLPPLSATKTNTAGQSTSVTKTPSVLASLQTAQQSEDSSQDSSDESDSEEDSLSTQAAVQETQKPFPTKVQDAKGTGAPPGNAQSTGKGMANSPKSAAPLRKTSESSETDSSDSSGKEAAEKPARKPPIHPFFKQMVGKGAKDVQFNSSSTSVTPQKQGAIKEVESSSEESSDSDPETSQSLLADLSGPVKAPASTALKNAAPTLLKQSPGKNRVPTPSALAKTPGKLAPVNISSSDSSDSDTAAEGTVGIKAETSMLSSSGKEPVVAKVPKGAKVAKKKEPGSSGPKASRAKKATAKVQSNGKTTGTPTISLTIACLSKAQPADVGPKETVALTLGAAGQEAATAIPGVAGKTPEAAKEVKKGEKKKPSKKRKLAAGDAGLEETTGKKLKVQGDPKALAKEKKKKKKKAKSSDDTKTPKKKDGKEKTADKKKKKSKKLESLSQDDLQKKKKKKKKSGDLEGTT